MNPNTRSCRHLCNRFPCAYKTLHTQMICQIWGAGKIIQMELELRAIPFEILRGRWTGKISGRPPPHFKCNSPNIPEQWTMAGPSGQLASIELSYLRFWLATDLLGSTDKNKHAIKSFLSWLRVICCSRPDISVFQTLYPMKRAVYTLCSWCWREIKMLQWFSIYKTRL